VSLAENPARSKRALRARPRQARSQEEEGTGEALARRSSARTAPLHAGVAIAEINKAIGAIKHAAIDDGKNIDDHPSVDLPADYRGRLHKALDLLNKVHSDVAREEDDPQTRELRDRAVVHIDAAIDATRGAIQAVDQHR
jgi:hypothetical protein